MKRLLFGLLVVTLIAVSALTVSAAGAREEAAYPARDIEFIVPYGAGGSTDQFVRALVPHLEAALGVSVVVRNVTGGGGAVGYAETLAKPADGYTVTVPNNAMFTLEGMGYVDFSYQDFDNIARVILEDYVLTVGADTGFQTAQELADYARQNPGEVQIGHSGVGSSTHIVTVALMEFLGVDVDLVPYEGGAAAMVAAMGGHVHGIVQHPAEIISAVAGGDLVPLASMGDVRAHSLPDTPTMKEAGLDFTVLQWRGIGFPGGVSDEVKQVWVSALEQAVTNPSFQRMVEEQLVATLDLAVGDAFDEFEQNMADVFIPIARKFAE